MSKSNISSNIEKSRNTSEQFDWYKRREDVLRKIDVMDVAIILVFLRHASK